MLLPTSGAGHEEVAPVHFSHIANAWEHLEHTHTHSCYPLQSALTMGWQVAAGWTLPRDRTKHFLTFVCVCVLECVRVCSSLENVKVCWIWIIRDKQKRPWGDWRWESECSAARKKKGKSQSDSSGSRVSHLVFFVFSLIHRLADCCSWVWLMDKTLYCRGLKSRRGSGIDVGSSSVVFFDTTILLCG